MRNETTDLVGPEYIRKLLQDGLSQRGFQTIDLVLIDQKLKENGFTEGGQLGAATAEDLGKWLEADSLFFSTLEDFNYVNLGFYGHRKVKVLAWIVDAQTGEKLWEAEKTGMTLHVATKTEDAEKAFARDLAVQAIEKIAKVPLQPESRIAVTLLLDTLPHR